MGQENTDGPVKPFDERRRAAQEAERENAIDPARPPAGGVKGGKHPDEGPNQQGEGKAGVGD